MTMTRAYIMVVCASILWGSAFLFGKICLEYLPPLHQAALRLTLACLMLAVIVRKNPFRGISRKAWPWLILYSFLQTVLTFSLFNFGLSLVPSSFGSMVVGMSPAISAGIATAFLPEEKMDMRLLGGIVLGFSAIIALSYGRQSLKLAGAGEILGVVLLVFNNMAGAFSNVLVKKKLKSIAGIGMNLVQMIIGTGVVILLALAFESHEWKPLPAIASFSLISLAFITAAATTLWLKVVQEGVVPISQAVMVKLLIPTVGTLLGWLFVPGDNPSWLAGGALLVLGFAIYLSLSRSKPRRVVDAKKLEVSQWRGP